MKGSIKMTNIKPGIITEKELVELFGSQSQKKSFYEKGRLAGSYRTALFKKLNKYCTIKELKKKKDGENLYKITEVYKYPLPANYDKMQKSIYKYIVPLILNSLINGHDKNNSIEITVGKWAREINMINHNYNLVKYNREDTSKEVQIRLDTINEFYDKADHMINWYISNALDYLKSAGLIIWREVNQVTIEESDNKSIIDCDGNVEVNINLRTHQASKEEMEYYSQCIAIADKEAKTKAMELMKRVGLEDQLAKKTGKYSRGMRQRLGLADVLIKNPEIIILDEPTSGIDPAGVQEFIELIRWLSKEEGLTVLFSSHHLDQVQKVCDRVGLFSNGQLLALIDMAELKDKKQELSDIYNHYFEEGGERHE